MSEAERALRKKSIRKNTSNYYTNISSQSIRLARSPSPYSIKNAPRFARRSRDFYLYARDWWKSYQEISSLHASRNGVKIFAEDETGTHRSVCTFVEGVRTGRLIDSPRHAAR